MAYLYLDMRELARQEFMFILQYDPENKEAREQLKKMGGN
jgi:hypothetical protein